MTPEDIERMAREAGGSPVDHDDPQCSIGEMAFGPEELTRFAALVRAQALEIAAQLVQANAEACRDGGVGRAVLESNAAAIRALGDTK